MLSNVLQLEATKQKNAFVAILIIIAISLVLGLGVGWLNHKDRSEVLAAMAILFMTAGVPLLAVLLGGSAGAGLRHQTARAAEELLPFSPVRKVLGAYAVSLGYFAALGGVLIAFGYGMAKPDVMDSFVPVDLLLTMTFFLHLLSFLFCYWLRQPFFGGGLALIVVGIETFLVYILYSLRYIEGGPNQNERRFLLWAIATLITTAASGITSLTLLAKKIELERPTWFRTGALATILASSGIWMSYIPVYLIQTHVQKDLHPLFYYGWVSGRDDVTGSTQAALTEGMLAQTESGTVVRIGSDATRKVISHSEEISMTEIPQALRTWYWGQDVTFSPDGSAWILKMPDYKRNPNLYEILVVDPPGHVKHVTTFPTKESVNMMLVGDEMVLGTFNDRKHGWLTAAIPLEGKEPVWSEDSFPLRTVALKKAADSGAAAILGSDRKTLTQTLGDGSQRLWNLPGEVFPDDQTDSYVLPAFGNRENATFALPVASENDTVRLVLCKPDGSVQFATQASWRSSPATHLKPIFIPGGGKAWAWPDRRNPTSLLVIGPDGRIYPLLNPGKIVPGEGISLTLRRLSGNDLWAVAHGHFVKFNLVKSTLTNDYGVVAEDNWKQLWNVYGRSTKEGLYFVQDDNILLINWEGQRKNLGRARVD